MPRLRRRSRIQWRSRLRFRALITEALAGVFQRPGRAVLTSIGTVLGVGAFVAVLGLTASATGQISKDFTALAATEVTIEDVAATHDVNATRSFPADADRRVEALNGVRNAGLYWTVPPSAVGTVTGRSMPGQVADAEPVLAVSGGFLRAVRPTVRAGRLFDDGHNDRKERVAVLGIAVAHRLGITDLRFQPAVLLGGIAFTVVGVISDVQRQPGVLLGVLVPERTAAMLWPHQADPTHPDRMLIETRLGAAQLVGSQVPLALRPDQPQRFHVIAPADPRSLHNAVNTELSSLFLVLAGVCLIIGVVGIANSTLVAVLERESEMGLRRALGARPRHIAGQVLVESTLLGTWGGLVGAGLGVLMVIGVAVAERWTPVIEVWSVWLAPLAGLMAGVMAGLYPAARATRIEPAEALRR